MDEGARRAAIALYDRFTHDGMDRRAFIADMSRIAGSAAAAAALIGSIAADPAAAALTAADDPTLATHVVEWKTGEGRTLRGYLAAPRAATTPLPAVVVIHENRGLNAYVEDVARRVALAGFLAVAPDFLTAGGGTPADEDAARAAIAALDPATTVADAVATIDWLRHNPRGTGHVGVIGFCWGGGLVDRTAVAAGAKLDAAVAFYGPTPDPAGARRVRAHMLLHYAGLDTRVNAGAGPWVDALKAAKVDVRAFTYAGVDHAFHNDTSAARYNAAAATLAWDRTIAFLRETLAPPAATSTTKAMP